MLLTLKKRDGMGLGPSMIKSDISRPDPKIHFVRLREAMASSKELAWRVDELEKRIPTGSFMLEPIFWQEFEDQKR